MSKHADWMANSVDPDQTAPGAVWSGSTLFAQAYLSKFRASMVLCLPLNIHLRKQYRPKIKLKKQFDQGLHCLPIYHYVRYITRHQMDFLKLKIKYDED